MAPIFLARIVQDVRKLIAGYGVVASRRAARRTSGIVVVSRLLEGVLRQAVGDRDVRIIPCGMDVERFTPLEMFSPRV